MSEKSVEERVDTILVEHLGLTGDPKPGESLADDLDCDSLDAIELAMALEEELGIEIPDDDALECKTVEDIHNLINKIRGDV